MQTDGWLSMVGLQLCGWALGLIATALVRNCGCMLVKSCSLSVGAQCLELRPATPCHRVSMHHLAEVVSAHRWLQIECCIAHYMGTMHAEVKGAMLHCIARDVQLSTRSLYPVRCASIQVHVQFILEALV
jgi:hypothetical protein